MFQVRGIALVAAMLLGCGASFAEDLGSANHIMVGCRSAVAGGPSKNSAEALLRGYCMGITDTLFALSGIVCPPKGSTTGQTVRIVVKYIDERPARMHENFTALALEALRAAWPCRN